ncbi:hypothetical protein BEWA_028800 [Theileria equi strain WA]|uniref:Uncharacterized protein n=1 Tax=Theileria equi strain WA TaxID=1537102 RepID=L0AWV2_THEEQ|nr:hypothetical protein BEWA_028800 [Theileria equi strain WA]AFZ80030.1 hypothetical protein BEWA_028800 [Theileria equi strain WA]|eukprot:XP_004829696.1 hypothetical protein BEWA_028800 [Theileria equi strain WA]
MFMMKDDCGVLTLNVDIRCGENELSTCQKTPQGPITAKKNDNNAEGFVRYTHESLTSFTLSYNVDGCEELSARYEIPNVTSVSALCWVDELATPLLLEVETTTDTIKVKVEAFQQQLGSVSIIII